jgi:hypothetical protein
MSKYLQKELGGRKLGLKFNIGTVFIAREVAGEEIAHVPADLQESVIITYSALLSNCRTKKEEPDFTLKDVAEWVLDLGSLKDIKDISEAFQGIIKLDVPQEGNADTQQAAHPA